MVEKNWLAGRAGRRTYWLSVAIAFATMFVLSAFDRKGVRSGLSMALLLIQIPRLHDFGRTGWWAVAAFAGPLALALMLWPVTSLELAGLAEGMIAIAIVIWIGVIPGEPGENRFGPPPRPILSYKRRR